GRRAVHHRVRTASLIVLVLCNLKARKLAGFPSNGMVMCASNEEHTEVKLVSIPVDAKVRERITVPRFDFENGGGESRTPRTRWGRRRCSRRLLHTRRKPTTTSPAILATSAQLAVLSSLRVDLKMKP
ncbi:hypothetical protein ACHAWF_012831, partial [Thalassiosira exigua]